MDIIRREMEDMKGRTKITMPPMEDEWTVWYVKTLYKWGSVSLKAQQKGFQKKIFKEIVFKQFQA